MTAAAPERRDGAPVRRRRVIVALVAFVALVAISVLAGTGVLVGLRSSPEAHAGDLGAARVSVIGDSLTKASVAAIRDELDAGGFVPTVVDGINGEEIIKRRDQLVQASQPGGADVAVIALGTNNVFFASVDDLRRKPMEASIRDLDQVITDVQEGVGGVRPATRCLVWVNVNDRTDTDGLRTWAPVFNQAVADRARRENVAGRPMRVADWASFSRAQPSYFVEDGIHLTTDGQRAYARLIRETIDTCR
ncbi:MAG: hypothetical protein HYX32_02550 [Actinobacteria bacterium]|nr:hypothetical protein [Actinomycetota bacterium]